MPKSAVHDQKMRCSKLACPKSMTWTQFSLASLRLGCVPVQTLPGPNVTTINVCKYRPKAKLYSATRSTNYIKNQVRRRIARKPHQREKLNDSEHQTGQNPKGFVNRPFFEMLHLWRITRWTTRARSRTTIGTSHGDPNNAQTLMY